MDDGWAPQPVKKRCWWSRLRTEGAGVGVEFAGVDAGEEENRLFGPEADVRDVADIGAKRSAT